MDFLVEQEAHRGDDPATPAVSESRSSQVRASVDAALRGGLAGPEATPEDESQQKALEEIARRFSPQEAEEALRPRLSSERSGSPVDVRPRWGYEAKTAAGLSRALQEAPKPDPDSLDRLDEAQATPPAAGRPAALQLTLSAPRAGSPRRSPLPIHTTR